MNTVPDAAPQELTATVARPTDRAGASDVPARMGEFELVSKLGEGSFGQVFLARQGSLGRHVALKVIRGARADDRGEGQLLAGLEHDHIVKVYSAFADPATGTHGLCLQYVPGADLGVVIRRVFAAGAAPGSGRVLLAALDAVRRGDSGFDPAALRDREALAGDDFPQAVCRIGGRLAEALAFAHARGVLHCDIKPGNILLNPYGRPLLADFNVAFDRTRHRAGETHFGGTFAYMAPEYRAAMYGQPGGCADERCDVYSLGVVLHELATGTRPPAPPSAQNAETIVPGSSAPAGAPGPTARPGGDGPLDRVPRELAAVIRRCLDPDPARRYGTAGELAGALSGAWHLLAVQRALPRPRRVGRWVLRRPALALALAAILPHVIASAAQIGYNAVEVRLDGAQQRAFLWLVLGYNAVAYPVCGGTAVLLVWQVVRRLKRLADLSGPEVDALRRRAARLGGRLAALGALGWFPGALVFPLVIDAVAGALPGHTYAHFATSFTLAGVIGVVFSYLGTQYAVFRALLPRLGNPDAYTPAGMWAEVRPLTAPFGPLVLLACGVPLLGAVLLLTLDDSAMTFRLRLLVVKLIVLGAAGVALAEGVVRTLRQLAAVWHVEAEGRDAEPECVIDDRELAR